MKFQIVGKNITITKGIEDKIVKKLTKFEKYFSKEEDILCRSVCRTYKVGAKVEITIFSKEMIFRAEVQDQDLYAAVDLCIDKLLSQMRKLKTKLQNRSKKEKISKSIIYENLESEALSEAQMEVIRTKSVDVKPLSVENAITTMEAIGHDFYLYYDADDEKMSVVYKRKDGGYGLIQSDLEVKI